MKVSDLVHNAAGTLTGALKILLYSQASGLKPAHRSRPLIVMGNGPSLRKDLAEHRDALEACDLMAVNFAATAEVFSELKPEFYILVDPLFFSDTEAPNVHRLREALSTVSWPMTLLVPVNMRRRLDSGILANKNITVTGINAVGVDGFETFRHMAFDAGLAMPRPRNVLIPAIMCGIRAGYDTIYIIGADHSWMQTISVDDENHVISVQPHFYKDDKSEQKRVDSEYAGYRLHDIVLSFYVAFRSYHDIAAYARHRGVTIYNATPGSFIDAFDRRPLPSPK